MAVRRDVVLIQPPLPRRTAAVAVARCAGRVVVLLARRQVRQPRAAVGRAIHFGDGSSSVVYRETVIDRRPPSEPVVLVVGFRLRAVHSDVAHRLFRLESELNTLLFAGFPGLVSKLWLRHDEHGRYRGIYQWDGADDATAYARALWRVLDLVCERGSIDAVVLPGRWRDDVCSGSMSSDGEVDPWWRPTAIAGPLDRARRSTPTTGGHR